MDHRSVIDQNDKNTFNRDYNRTFLSFMINNVLLQEFKVTFTVEYWNTEGVDHSRDIGVDLDKKIGKFDVGGGTSYSLYKYNFTGSNDLQFLQDSELSRNVVQQINVRTYYSRIKYLLTKQSDVSLRWSMEISDTDPRTFHQLLLSYSTNF